MKIEKEVDTTIDVTVDVSLEDITACIWESTDRLPECLRGVSNAHRFLKAIPDEIIAQMTPQARATINAALIEQAARYVATSSGVRDDA